MFLESVEEDSDGNALRQVPNSENKNSSLWISETGLARRRYFNPFVESWSWSHIIHPHVNDNGKRYFHVKNRKIEFSKAIAMAWIINKNNSKYPRIINQDEDVSVVNMDWDDEDEICLEDEEQSEIWKPFMCHSNIPLDEEYHVSSLGRFRNKLGQISEPTFVNGKRVVCLSCGTIDVDNAIDNQFNGVQQIDTCIPARIEKLITHLREDPSLDSYALKQNLRVSTVWSYMYDVFLVLDVEECVQIAQKIISQSAWNAMRHIFSHEGEGMFSMSAKRYMEVIDRILCDDADWKCNPYRFNEIRLLKLICEKSICVK